MARPRASRRQWQSIMRHELRVNFAKDKDVHTLLYMSEGQSQEIILEALRRFVRETNHPAGDVRVQSAVTMRALGFDPSAVSEFDGVLNVGQSPRKPGRQSPVIPDPVAAKPPPQAREPVVVVQPPTAPEPAEEAPVITSEPIAAMDEASPVITEMTPPDHPLTPPVHKKNTPSLVDRWLDN